MEAVEKKELKFNPKSRAFLDAVIDNYSDYYLDPKDVVPGKKPGAYQEGFKATFQAGRGSAKTFTELALIAISAYELPKALAAIGSRTFKQVVEIILSQSNSVWERFNLSEYSPKNNPYGNYVVNRRPPEHFDKPWVAPRNYENCITFANGYTLMYTAADRPDTQRGLNLDQYFGDESAFTKREFYTKNIVPAVRSNAGRYHDKRKGRKGFNHPLHWLMCHFSSAPYHAEGMWIYDNEEKMLEEIKMKNGYHHYFHLEATAYDNIEFLPGNYIETQQAELTPHEFDVEILNKRVKKQPNAFYPSFSHEKHVKDFYTYDFDDATGTWPERDNSCDTMKPLHMSWDFNGYFTSSIIAQELTNEFRFINEIWAKESETNLIDKVCDKFIETYKYHIKKTVMIYGDAGGHQKFAGSNESFFSTIFRKLRTAGWSLIDQTENTYPPFKARYKVINEMLAGTNPKLPRLAFNTDTTKNLVISIVNTRTQKDSFEKFKGDEGKKHIAQETVTHLSDAFDYMIYKKFAAFVESSSARGGMIAPMS